MTTRPWLQHYPEGVPANIPPLPHASLADFIQHRSQQHSDQTAYHHLGTDMSFAEAEQWSHQISSALQQFGIKKGDRIAIMLPNMLAHPLIFFGALRAGAVTVMVNPLYTPRELHNQLQDSGARLLFVLESFGKTVYKALPGTYVEQVVQLKIGDAGHPWPKSSLMNLYARYFKQCDLEKRLSSISFKAFLGSADGLSDDVSTTQEDIALLQYTGGTTGLAKAAMLSHGNLLANLAQTELWVKQTFHKSNPRIITALPLYHIFALLANGLLTFSLGGCSHLITNPREIDSFVAELSKSEFHGITGVNTLYNTLLRHPKLQRLDFSELQLALSGGMSLQKNVAQCWHELTGTPLIEAYGLTETSPALCARPAHISEFTGSVGFPLPSTDISIRDGDGNELPYGEAGELWAKGPQVMSGYWRQPEETRKVLNDDGWLRTGDIAVMSSDGEVTIADRKKDLIIISGFNVYPNEIEDVLCMHPAIKEAGVIGVPQEDATNDVIKAFIVCSGTLIEKEDIIAHCRDYLAAYKIPKIIEYVDELPKTNVGKILRRALK